MNQGTSTATEKSIFVRVFSSVQKRLGELRSSRHASSDWRLRAVKGAVDDCSAALSSSRQHQSLTLPDHTFGCVRLAEAVVLIMLVAEQQNWPLAEAIEELARRRIEQGSERESR